MSKTLGIYFTHFHCIAVITEIMGKSWVINKPIKIRLSPKSTESKKQALIEIKRKINRPKKIILGLPHQIADIKTLSVDRALSDHEIATFLENHTTEKYIDFEYLPTDSKNTKRIRAVSANSTDIEDQINLFNSAKLPLHVIDIDCFALMRLQQLTKTLLPTAKNQKAVINLPVQKNNIHLLVSVGLSLWGRNP